MPDQRSKRLAFTGPWVAYAAALWASVFAVFHIVWAAGWYPLLHAEQARIAFATPWKWAFDVLVAAMCVIAVPVVLAPVMSWGQHLPRRLIDGLACIGTALLVLRSTASLVQTGYFASVGRFRFAAIGIWEWWFHLGAILFALSTWRLMAIRHTRRLIERAGVIDNAPGPSPWYLRTGKPAVPGFAWGGAGDSSQIAGATVLSGRDGVVLILDFHNYVLPIDPETLLVWHQRHVETGPSEPVMLRIFRLADLRPLEGDLEELCGSMRRFGAPFMASGSPLCEFPIPTTVTGRLMRLKFPDQLRHIEELLILCHSSAVEASPTWELNNLALLVARPSAGTYELFPQDWFNSANLDYSYQWVTRVARDPQTGRIHGDGIRISPFVLDDTLRNAL